MIVIPKNYSSGTYDNDDKFIDLIKLMNALEEDLEFPICSSREEYNATLRIAQFELIRQGYL